MRQRQIRNLKNKSQRRRVYATDPSSAKRSIHAKQTSNRPFPSRLHYVYNYIEMMIIWTLFSLLRYKNLYYRLCRKFYSRKNEEQKNPKRHHPRCCSNNNNANVQSRPRTRIRAEEDARKRKKRTFF